MDTEIICTVDVVFLTVKDGKLQVALFKRPREPFANVYALPGGFIRKQEDSTAFDAAMRVLEQKTGVRTPYLEQLATFSGASRDPRGWSVTIVYSAMVRLDILEAAQSSEMKLVPVDGLRDLPFDHKDIVNLAVERTRTKSSYSTLPFFLCKDEFTLPELQSIYESIRGSATDKVTFRRKVLEAGCIEPTGQKRVGGQHRAPDLYRLKEGYRHTLVTFARPFS